MRRTPFATIIVIAASMLAAPAFARDDGPRFAQDRLDALVAHHREANRHIEQSASDSERVAQSKTHNQLSRSDR